MNYSELYKIITKFYPLEVNELNQGYHEYPGIKELFKLSNKMFDSKNYGNWKMFISSFDDGNNGLQGVNWESLLSEWCYTGSLILNKRTIDSITHVQELVLNVSFLAPVYTVYGRDRIEYLENGNLMEFNPFLTVSPHGTYEQIFYFSKQKVEGEYPGYKFISFNLLSERVKLIHVPGSIDDQGSTVYQALFKLHDITNFPYQGNSYYE